jgi:hypothetical protein
MSLKMSSHKANSFSDRGGSRKRHVYAGTGEYLISPAILLDVCDILHVPEFQAAC